MALFDKILGRRKSPTALQSSEEAAQALAALRKEREDSRARLVELADRRRTALGDDVGDEKIAQIDEEQDAALLVIERCDAIEPRLIAKLAEVQSAARAARLAELIPKFKIVEGRLDAALEAAVTAFAEYRVAIAGFSSEGFEDYARTQINPPPAVGVEGVIASPDLLELWRRSREDRSDMAAAATKLQPPARPVEKAVAPPAAPRPDPQYRPTPGRKPMKVEDKPAFGFVKVVMLRNGVEVDGKARVLSDELIVSTDLATALCKSGAADILERGKLERAAE
ncbi:MAG: hypothetical protein U1E28_21925 [Beijerinckiaceae bacterium]